MSSSREKILKALQKATKIKSHLPEMPNRVDDQIQKSVKSITPQNYHALREQFKKELEAVAGEFQICKSRSEVVDSVHKILAGNQYPSLAIAGNGLVSEIAGAVAQKIDLKIVVADELTGTERIRTLAQTPVALVEVTFGVADVASMALLFDDSTSTLSHFLPDCIITILRPQQLLANLFELFSTIPPEKAKNMVLITGPSRTADIEKILILGAHGPRRLVVIMLEDHSSEM